MLYRKKSIQFYTMKIHVAKNWSLSNTLVRFLKIYLRSNAKPLEITLKTHFGVEERLRASREGGFQERMG